MRIWILILLASALGAQTTGSAGGGTAAPSGDRNNGQKIFASYGCYQCHGRSAQGGVGPRLGPKPILFAAFLKYLRQPSGEMPPYTAKVVSEKEAADIYTFLQSIPTPPAVRDIPELK